MKTSKGLHLGILLSVLSQLTLFAATHSLTVNLNGSGTVTTNPTASAYPHNSTVTLTASASVGWQFNGWNGDINGTLNPTNVLMDADKVITANFSQLAAYSLTVNVTGAGSVSPNGGSYTSNSVVQLTATASNGWRFDHWTGDASGSANPVSITMNGNKIVGATFGQPVTITGEPQDTSAPVGTTAKLSVTATGSPPLSYTWYFNQSAISGGTSPGLNLTNVQSSDAGNYFVIVTNAYGAATSRVAVLLVPCGGTNTVAVATDAALRSAIAIGGDVRLCFNGTVVLTNTINITRNVSLDASGQQAVISGNNSVRLFNVSTGVTLIMTNIGLTSGRVTGVNGTNAGGGPSQLAEAGYAGQGAGIYNDGGVVKLFGCALSNHVATGGNGGAGTSGFNPYGAEAGAGRGAAVFNNAGTVELTSCVLSNNSSVGGVGGTSAGSASFSGAGGTALGAALFNNNGTARVINSLFISNLVSGGQGGALPSPYRGGDARGAAIATINGFLGVTNSVLRGNGGFVTAGPDTSQSTNAAIAQGGAVYVSGGSATLDSTAVQNNFGQGAASPNGIIPGSRPGNAAGGAIFVEAGSLSISSCTIAMNEARGGAGFRNTGAGRADGGAIYNKGTLRMNATSISTNVALSGGNASVNASGFGGALANLGTAVLSAVVVDGNTVSGGNAPSFSGTSFSGGDAFGGGIWNSGTLALTNTTVAQNVVQGGAPGPVGFPITVSGNAGNAYGGAIHNQSGTVTLSSATLASNSLSPGIVGSGGGGGLAFGGNIANSNGTVTCRATALASSSANVWGTVTDGGYNFSSDGSANFSGGTSFNFTDPKLLALANNGGPTRTMALAPDSPAIDWVPATNAPATDQRGVLRPYGPASDVGAFELEVGAPPAALACKRNGTALELSFQVSAGVPYRIEHATTLPAWQLYENLGVVPTNGTIRRTIPSAAARDFFRVVTY